MRTVKTFSISLNEAFKARILQWAIQFGEVVWLDGNTYSQKNETYRAILAVDAFTALKTDAYKAFDNLNDYQTAMADWIFGYLTYDLKNDVEALHSNNFDGLDFPDLYFFQPKKIFLFTADGVELHYLNLVADEMEEDLRAISETNNPSKASEAPKNVKISIRTPKDSYLRKVEAVLEHIRRGDIYEANICQEFFSENAEIDTLEIFLQLNKISKAPFSAFLKLDDRYAFSASPERYIKRAGKTVISQPIKGTAKRSDIVEEDLAIKQQLANDSKERSENIMIADLVRNDLSRFAKRGSVTVDELCEIYTFEQVHQMISTIRCEVPLDFPSVEILRNTFPMGSMTGAPKISAMQIIEDTEDTKRGLYSGAIGYFSPSGNFDFNVVIRSILYNAPKKYLSFSVGSAITINSIPEKEYEECLLKAKALRQVLHSTP